MFRSIFRTYKQFYRFNGRASVYEYKAYTRQMWFLLALAFFGVGSYLYMGGTFNNNPSAPWVFFTLMVSTQIGYPALCVRRLHDIGRSGWWIFVPLVNWLWMTMPSQDGENDYGPPSGV
ncbi:DUF805 domain-containing protein [Kordiimonas sediminis]|uniref:DUF805 domain-containing protein n=1 Tax=Kordiimonas sediminis TaxID=1735581 RepID=UPI00174CEA72